MRKRSEVKKERRKVGGGEVTFGPMPKPRANLAAKS